MNDKLIEIVQTTNLIRDMSLNGATEGELWKVVEYIDSVIHNHFITLGTSVEITNLKKKYQHK